MSTPASTEPHNGRRYLLGLGLGFIPILLEWVAGLLGCPGTHGVGPVAMRSADSSCPSSKPQASSSTLLPSSTC